MIQSSGFFPHENVLSWFPPMGLLNPVDIGIAAITAFCVIRGFFRGFIKEVFSLVGALAGFYIACIYYTDAAKLLVRWVPAFGYLNIISFVIIFIGIFTLISIVGTGIKYLLNIVLLGWVDRIFGMLFGAAKGVLIGAVLLFVLTAFVPQSASMIKSSTLAPEITRISEKMIGIVPAAVKRQFIDKIEVFKKKWKTEKKAKK
jgi:membrane protein required for colicin V production